MTEGSTRNGREARRSDSLNKGSWPFRSQSFDRANVNRRSLHLYLPENEPEPDTEPSESSKSIDCSDDDVQVRNAQIRKMSDIEDILRSGTNKKQRSVGGTLLFISLSKTFS